MTVRDLLGIYDRGLTHIPIDLYGTSKTDDHPANGIAIGAGTSLKTRTVVHLSLCDSIPAYGAISDMTFSLARVGVRLNLMRGMYVLFLTEVFLGSSCRGACRSHRLR